MMFAHAIRVFVLCILLLPVFAGGAVGQSRASASAASSSSDGMVDVSIGGFVFESGSRVALEFVRSGNVNCFDATPAVESLRLLDEEETLLQEIPYDPAVDVTSWIGRLTLTEGGGSPLPTGPYRVVVTTNVGTFTVKMEVVDAAAFARLGRFEVRASICSLELRIYRLVTQEDDGAALTLRQGDRLMVALAGNATTGFEWMNTLLYEYAVLRETEEHEYRAKPNPEEMVGFGGEFLFRYIATDTGVQAFRFAYQRPWESVQPEQIVEFEVTVR